MKTKLVVALLCFVAFPLISSMNARGQDDRVVDFRTFLEFDSALTPPGLYSAVAMPNQPGSSFLYHFVFGLLRDAQEYDVLQSVSRSVSLAFIGESGMTLLLPEMPDVD